MNTREAIISLGDKLIRDKGYNAFSFYDLSKALKVKNASIHYHFPTKADLGVSILKEHQDRLEALKRSTSAKRADVKLKSFLSVYTGILKEGRVCLVGSLATDFKTVEPKMAQALRKFADGILFWVTAILNEGREEKIFAFQGPSRTKALMIISNMMAALQIARLTKESDFKAIHDRILEELKP